MTLEKHIEDIRAGLRAGRFANEASVSQGIVLRLLDALSWPTYDTQVVCPEYALQNLRVDFALCHPPGKPIAFVEVKQVGLSEGAERQLFDYAFHVGVPLAILTDGREWNFFLPGEQGDYRERRVYKLDLLEREVSESAERLTRYLKHESIASGAAMQAARDDYRNVSRARTMRDTLPIAWQKLVEEGDDLLIELIADRVGTLCGFKPDPDTVVAFLKELFTTKSTIHDVTVRPVSKPVSLPRNKERVSPTPGTTGFTLFGQFQPERNAVGVLVGVFEALGARDATFFQRFASLPKHGNTRRYLAQSPEELFPDRPDMVRSSTTKLKSGWYLGTNVSRAAVTSRIEMACEVAGIQFGRDLQINLGK